MDKSGTVTIEYIEALRDHRDDLATRISTMWTGFKRSSANVQRRSEVSEVKRFLNATSTRDTSNNIGAHSHSTHRPKLAQIADTLEAHYTKALLPNEDWIQFAPDDNDAASQVVRNRMEEYIRNRHRLYGHRTVITNLLRDWIEDMCFAEVVWKSETVSNEIPGMPIKGYIGPQVRRIAPEKIAFDPKARSFHDSWKIIQSIKTYGDIALEIADETLPPEYREVLDKAMKFRHYARGYAEHFGEEWDSVEYEGWGTNDHYFRNQESAEILTFYGTLYDSVKQELHLNQEIVIIDRKWVLYQTTVNSWDGKPYIYASSWRNRPDSLIGMCPLENLTGMQYSINHLQNSKADVLDEITRPDRYMQGIDDIRHMEDGSKLFVSHEPGGKVGNIAPDVNILNADFHIETLERKMEEYAGVPRSAAGIKVPGEQTKFEVQTLHDAGTLLFQSKIEKFEAEILERAVNAELELARRRLDQNLNILVSQEEGDIFEDISPDLMKNKGSLVARGARHYAQQARMVQELTQFLQNTASRPDILVHFPAKKIAQAYNRLLGSFGDRDGLYEEYGGLTEQVEAAQFQQAAAREIDQSAIATEQIDNPDLIGTEANAGIV